MTYTGFILLIIFQIIFNFFFRYIITQNFNIILLLISTILLSLFLLFLGKIKSKKQKIFLFILQIIFSLFVSNFILLIFAILIFLTIFREDIKSSISILKMILFLFFIFLPFLHNSIQEFIINKSLEILEPKIKEIIINQLENNLRINEEYIKNISNFGFDFAIYYFKIEKNEEITVGRKMLMEYIENQMQNLKKTYIEEYYNVISLNIKNFLLKHKLLISIIILLGIYYIVDIYLLLVTIFYEIFKRVIH